MGKVMLYIALFLVAIFAEAGCGNMVKDQEAVNAVEVMGFTDVQVIKRDVFFVQLIGGSERDNVRFTVEGTNPAGRRVQVYVFAGWPFKAATIRTK